MFRTPRAAGDLLLPSHRAEEVRPCARSIIERIATDAYRRPVDDADLTGLMAFYDQGEQESGFEGGIRYALEAILASPHFIFRFEEWPEGVEPGETYRISDVDLASRLSFFLWASPPDEELASLASANRLSGRVLREQTLRMLADPRASALSRRFAAQWLRLSDLEKLNPDMVLFPDYDKQLADALLQETALFFDYLFREDRPVTEFITADYTFVNERLANHYGIPAWWARSSAGSSTRRQSAAASSGTAACSLRARWPTARPRFCAGSG